MKRSFYVILFLCCLLFCTGCNQEIAQQQKPSESVTPPETVAPPPEPTLEERAAELVSKMTLEQKVGQLFFIRCPETEVEATIAQYQPGGILLFSRDFEPYTKEEVRSNLASYQQAAALPLLIGVDEEGGTVNRISRYPAFRSQPFPSPQALDKAGGLTAVQEDTLEKCQLLQELGINVNFAPVCDLSTRPEDFIYQRTFGKPAAQTADYVRTVVQVMAQKQTGSVLKHFPGYGNNADTHTGGATDQRDLKTFQSEDWLPFAAGIESGANAVLVSHNLVLAMDSQRPASLSPTVHKMLRQELHFSGVVLTDDLVMAAIQNYATPGEAAVLAVLAGNDMLISSDLPTQYQAVLEATQSQQIPQTLLDQSVTRILVWKLQLGLLGSQ